MQHLGESDCSFEERQGRGELPRQRSNGTFGQLDADEWQFGESRVLPRIFALVSLAAVASTSSISASFGDVIESNNYGAWHVFGGVGQDDKSICRLAVDIVDVPGAKLSIIHVSGAADFVLALSRDVWNIPQGTKTEIDIDFGTFHHIPITQVHMDASGTRIASFISTITVKLILDNLVAKPKIHFRGTEADWIIPFPRQGEPVADFARCLRGQQHTQPF